MRISIVMPAFNEEPGIGRVLRGLIESPDFGPDLEIVVAANGCTDATAEVARSFGVRVVEVAAASKPAALNAADEVATGSVRIYVDADVELSASVVHQLAAALQAPGVLAAVPRPQVDTGGSSWPVRAYYAVNARLPVFRHALFGRGVIALSAPARRRFDRFPELTADDMFLDAVVGRHERVEIDAVVRVSAPRRTGDLIRRVARARDGNAEFRRFVRAAPAMPSRGTGPDRSSWLRDVVLPTPSLWPAALCYVTVILLAELRRRSPGWDVRSGWGRLGPAGAARVPRPRRPDDVDRRTGARTDQL